MARQPGLRHSSIGNFNAIPAAHREPPHRRRPACANARQAESRGAPPGIGPGVYEKRWLIEESFRALKVGTRIKDRRLDQTDDLRTCCAFDAITACRVMTIARLALGRAERRRQAASSTFDEITVLTIDHQRQEAHTARTPGTRADHRSLRHRGRPHRRLHSPHTPTPAGNRESLAGIQDPPHLRRKRPKHAGTRHAEVNSVHSVHSVRLKGRG